MTNTNNGIQLTDQEKRFLDLYLGVGLKTSKQVECYRLAFPEKLDVQNSSIETYAKKLLARDNSKDYLSTRKVTDTNSTAELVGLLQIVDEVLSDPKIRPTDKINASKEKRQILSDLSKYIIRYEPTPTIDDLFALSDDKFNLVYPYKVDDPEFNSRRAMELLESAKSFNSFICIDGEGQIRLVKPLLAKHQGDLSLILEAIQRGNFQIVVTRP